MKNKHLKNNQKGFSLVELMLVLLVAGGLGSISYMTYNYAQRKINRENEGNNLVAMAKATVNFVTTYQTPLFNSTYNNGANNGIIILPAQTLVNYGYLSKSSPILNVKNPIDGSSLIPCVSIFSNTFNNSLQGFIYYRTDSNKQHTQGQIAEAMKDLTAGLRTNGSSLGIISGTAGNYTISGNGYSWSVNPAQSAQYFLNNSNVNTSAYLINPPNAKCGGANIASPAFIYYLGNDLAPLKQSDPMDSVDQYNNLNNPSNPTTNNIVNNLSMDATGTAINGKTIAGDAYQATAKNKLIFQNNPNCVMNPSKLSTMQDYDSTYNPLNCSTVNDSDACGGYNKPNVFGCRNSQLSIGNKNNVSVGAQDGQTNSVNAVVINGFTKNVTKNFDNNNPTNTTTNLGGLNAYSYQPTALVQYAQSCNLSDIGTMAQQDPNNFPTNMSTSLTNFLKLNISMLVCTKSMLCPNSVGATGPGSLKACWLPINTMTMSINFDESQNIVAYHAPQGFFIKDVIYSQNSTEIVQQPINKQQNRGNQPDNKQDNNAPNHCHYDYCIQKDPIFGSCLGGVAGSGGLNTIVDTQNKPFRPYLEMNGFFPALNLKDLSKSGNIWKQIKGWTVITDNFSGTTPNYLSPYNYWTMNGDEKNGTSPSPNTCSNCNQGQYHWNDLAQYTYVSDAINLPIIANPKVQIFGTNFGAGKWGLAMNYVDDCDGWKNSGTKWVIADTYHITNVIISNDTNGIIMNAANPPAPAPDIPPYKPTAITLSFNNYYTCSGTQDTNNPTIYHGGTCTLNNVYNNYTGSIELSISYTAQVIASAVKNGNDWTVKMSAPFLIDPSPDQTVLNATAAGVTNTLSYRYTAYSDNSCMVNPVNTGASNSYNCNNLYGQNLFGNGDNYCNATIPANQHAVGWNNYPYDKKPNTGGWNNPVLNGSQCNFQSSSAYWIAPVGSNAWCGAGGCSTIQSTDGSPNPCLIKSYPANVVVNPSNPNQCWLWNDSGQTSPHYSLRTTQP